MSDNKKIFIYRTDRLISRIRHMIYAWRFARKVNAQTVMLWLPTTKKYIPDDGVDFDFGLIFDLFKLQTDKNFSDLTVLNGKININENFPVVKEVLPLNPNRTEKQTMRELYSYGDNFISDDLVGYKFNGESRFNLLDELKELFQSLPIEESIKSSLEDVKRQLQNSPYTIVHVRRGDVIRVLRENMLANRVGDDDLKQLLKRTAPISLYLSKVTEQSAMEDSTILVSSDDPEVAAEIQARLGKSNCKLITDYAFRGYKIQRDFFEFLVFSGAKRIIGTRASVYGKYAAIFGGGEFVGVDFQPDQSELEDYFDTEVTAGLDIGRKAKELVKERLILMNQSVVG